ncbi:takeout, partial [Asbolus verrucosus]
CHRSDPRLSDCIKNSVESLRPLLARGIPEFDIPSCEPLCIPEVVIDRGAGAVAVRSTYRDIKVYGPSQFVLRHIRIDMERNRIRIKLWLPRLQLTSKYTMEGRILMMPISGTGTSRGNYTNIDATVSMHGQRIKKDNETYFNVKDFYVDFNIGHATIQLDDLFNGNKEL